MRVLGIFIFLTLPCLLDAADAFYGSGLFKETTISGPSVRASEGNAVEEFFEQYFSEIPKHFEWRERRVLRDKTHAHYRYDLYYRGRKVLFRTLDLHYNRDGWVQYASNQWNVPFKLPKPVGTEKKRKALLRKWKSRLSPNRQRKSNVKVEPVVWLGSVFSDQPQYAFRVTASARNPISLHDEIIDEKTGSLIAKIPVIRSIDNKIYMIHPDRSSLETVTLPGLGSGATTLTDDASRVTVRREQDLTTPEQIDVNPNTDYTGVSGFSDLATNPGEDYNHLCDTNAASSPPANCPNQEFDSVNVYFHVKNFRDKLDEYFTTLEASPNLDLDPLPVTVNALSIDTDGDGDRSDEADNAFYVTNFTDSNGVVRSGLFFLRPAPIISSTCGSGVVNFFDLARETTVITHEYQHYVTDKIAQLVPGFQVEGNTSGLPNVGDHLHEGYSDYFGVSYTSRVSGATVTVVGEHAFKECTAIQRDIGELKVFTDTADFENAQNNFLDPHIGGWSYASALWKLRTTLGVETVDLIALKSLFFLSTLPGFIESVESLVRADAALNGGVNAVLIRDVFYNQVRWVAGGEGGFSTSDGTGTEVGFKSCIAVASRGSVPSLSWAIFLTWLVTTLVVGRAGIRR